MTKSSPRVKVSPHEIRRQLVNSPAKAHTITGDVVQAVPSVPAPSEQDLEDSEQGE